MKPDQGYHVDKRFCSATPEQRWFGFSPDVDLYPGDPADKIDVQKTKRVINNAK